MRPAKRGVLALPPGPETLARPWAIPGTPGLTHRIGGLEKEDGSGDVSYDPANHELMTKLRVAKVAGIATDIPLIEVDDPDGRRRARARVGLHLRGHPGRRTAGPGPGPPGGPRPSPPPQPLPLQPGEILRSYRKVLVPEMNLGQLVKLVRAEFLVDARASTRPRASPSRRRRSSRPSSTSSSTASHATKASDSHMTDVAVPVTTKKDWTSDQEIRWCPGCGDFSILMAVQMLMPELGARREDTVFVSGIGCSSRFPYYMNTYGVHSIHGRAPAVATGIAVSRPDLHVWVITGDGDALSIGGNHLLHALRRNVNLTIILFNNQIYGLTKGQYSPTSEPGKVTKSTPFGSLDYPYNPVSLALGAEATFVARTHDMERKHMMETIRRAYEHKGASLVEVYQNCNVFNDGAFDLITRQGCPAQDADPPGPRRTHPVRTRRRMGGGHRGRIGPGGRGGRRGRGPPGGPRRAP